MSRSFPQSLTKQLPMRDATNKQPFFTIQIAELHTLRPPLEQLMSSLPKGFDTLLSWVLFGPDGNYTWEYHEDAREADRYQRAHVQAVSNHVAEYWDMQYYDASYGSFTGSIGNVPYDKIIEYYEYVIGYLIDFVSEHLPYIARGDFLRITGFTTRQTYVVVYYQ